MCKEYRDGGKEGDGKHRKEEEEGSSRGMKIAETGKGELSDIEEGGT